MPLLGEAVASTRRSTYQASITFSRGLSPAAKDACVQRFWRVSGAPSRATDQYRASVLRCSWTFNSEGEPMATRMSRGEMIRRLDEAATEVHDRLGNGPLMPEERLSL